MIEKLTKLQSDKWEQMMPLKDKKKFIYQFRYQELMKDILAINRTISILKAED